MSIIKKVVCLVAGVTVAAIPVVGTVYFDSNTDINEGTVVARTVEDRDVHKSDRDYYELSFNSVDDFVASLDSVYNEDYSGSLTGKELYAEKDKVFMTLYTSNDEKLQISELANGKIGFVKLVGNDLLCEKVKNYMIGMGNSSGFKYKEINGGCILEA